VRKGEEKRGNNAGQLEKVGLKIGPHFEAKACTMFRLWDFGRLCKKKSLHQKARQKKNKINTG